MRSEYCTQLTVWTFNMNYDQTEYKAKGHFRVPKNLTFKARLSAKPLIWKWSLIMMQIKLIFTTKVSHLAKVRFFGTRKWPILYHADISRRYFFVCHALNIENYVNLRKISPSSFGGKWLFPVAPCHCGICSTGHVMTSTSAWSLLRLSHSWRILFGKGLWDLNLSPLKPEVCPKQGGRRRRNGLESVPSTTLPSFSLTDLPIPS